MRDSNPRHPRCKRASTTTELTEPQALTPTPLPVCTSEGEKANADTLEADSLGTSPQAADALEAGHQDKSEGIDQGDPLARLAAAIANLSPADRARLAAMFTGSPGGRN